ncbi:MAG: hypothetical protein EBX49_12570 [Synechococcaceae bacterium WB8_1B_136]|nr:hypothetical protein [Synechococcaceae bacterium WB8_1B_136]
MGLPTPGTNKIQVLRAVEDGWQAFCRAPWAFLLFQVLALVVMAPFAGLLVGGLIRLNGPEPAIVHPIAAGIGLVVGIVGYVVVALWGAVGLTRAAWLSLEGQKPSFRTFTRWDGAAGGRLLLSAILLAIVVAIVGAIAAAIGTGLSKVNVALTALPVIVFAIFYIWFLVTQKFLLQLSLFGVKQPVATLQAGINGVNPSWWVVLWLAIVESVLHGVAALFSYGGLFVLFPVMICISTAAYRQLFGSQDHTGLISGAQD